MPKDFEKRVDLRPEDWRSTGSRWQSPAGNDPRPGEKPHIWQEFERDRGKQRYSDEPFMGRGWRVLIPIAVVFVALFAFRSEGGPEWLIALRNLF